MNKPRQADLLKAAIPPADFYRQELPTMPPPRRDSGWVSGGLCPFHDDRHTGNFRINLDTGAYLCFACDARGGDIIAFLRCRDDLTFSEALEALRGGRRVSRCR